MYGERWLGCSAAKLDYTSEIAHLASLVTWRTTYYQIAWALSVAAIPLFLALFWVSLNWKRPDGP